MCWQIYVRQCQPIISFVVQQCLPLYIQNSAKPETSTSIGFWNKSYDLWTWALQFPCKIASRTPALEFVTKIVQINPLLSTSWKLIPLACLRIQIVLGLQSTVDWLIGNTWSFRMGYYYWRCGLLVWVSRPSCNSRPIWHSHQNLAASHYDDAHKSFQNCMFSLMHIQAVLC